MKSADRELVELAAKAVGYKIYIWGHKDDLNCARTDVKGFPQWNPLDDDGDALRLAVKLGLDVDVHRLDPALGGGCGVEVRGYVYRRLMITQPADNNEGLLEATRLAIVRAAAEIGRAMP